MRMDKLQARMVMEILGRPPENIIQALNMLLDRLAKEKGVKIVDKKVHDAVEAPGQKDLFTSFAEVEVELDSIANYLGIVFAYMPSHVELIYPENINLRNSDLNELSEPFAFMTNFSGSEIKEQESATTLQSSIASAISRIVSGLDNISSVSTNSSFPALFWYALTKRLSNSLYVSL